ncbi:hypothetical protein CYMTET_22185 [Cymbomonas tetramitiformis]|uniref:Uncharacterized protein n=1 Tax=Cymbomonas tetramitiformis TaxID=36881 RepID=A0AAE0L2E2_9CHLO|nr:hypothetical protein CYMTET_22185 [Cymbomonas tetramitiformis]
MFAQGRALLEKYKTRKGYRAVYAPAGVGGGNIRVVRPGKPIHFKRCDSDEYARFDLDVLSEDEVARATDELLGHEMYQAFSGLVDGADNHRLFKGM